MDSLDNTGATIFGRYPDNTPELLHLFESVDVAGEPKTVDAMMLAFILDPEHPLLPPQVKKCERHTVRAEHGDLGLGTRETLGR